MSIREPRQLVDATTSLRLIRAAGLGWAMIMGVLALVPVFSTETRLIMDCRLPYWILGAALLGGSVWLIVARIRHSWRLFVIGDFIVGATCLATSILMAVGAFHRLASGISVMLWLLPALLFLLNCALRSRWRS